MSAAEDTAALLVRGARRLALADQYEARALELAEREMPRAHELALAAHCFTIANALRGQARFRP